jgi:tRNA(Ile)-lysidine synthase
MIELIAGILSEHCLIKSDDPLLVAVSGGVDSLCLLDILDRLNFNIIIAHFDHSLRPESAAEAEKVRIFAENRNRKFILGKGDVFKYAYQKKQTIEEASRHARYRFLIKQAEIYNASAVAVGHNADDQVETILMHLLRGSGMEGLAGMSYRSLPNEWSCETAIIRPLLGIWREQLDEYIRENNLQPSLDSSNKDIKYLRNRIRHELVSYLEDYNPQIKNLILQLGDTIREDLFLINKITEDVWNKCLLQSGPGYFAFDHKLLIQQSLGVKRRLVRRAIHILRPKLRDFNFAAVLSGVNFINTPSRSGSIDLLSGVRMLIELNKLWIFDKSIELPSGGWPQLQGFEEFKLDIPGILFLPQNWQIKNSISDVPKDCLEYAKYSKEFHSVCLDIEKLTLPLTVRSRKPGDFIKPIGMGGHKIKLSDLFINKKIPNRLRDLWPIICSGDQVIWVPGLHLSHDFQINKTTKKVVQISLTKTTSN